MKTLQTGSRMSIIKQPIVEKIDLDMSAFDLRKICFVGH